MIVVCDINEVWRRKPFAALAEKTATLGVAPADWLVARRHPEFKATARNGKLDVLPVALPPSWASRTAWLGQRMLWSKIRKHCRARNEKIGGIVVTSPHYLPLLDLVPRGLKSVYYASDDYRSYEGWGAIAAKERQLVERVDHAFFVSEGLMERACRDYGVDPAKLSVSMNATEPRFFPVEGSGPVPPPCGELARPIAGVVGGINDRLDFDLLRRCADLPNLGTLLLVGPLPEQRSAALESLLAHPKCRAVGAQPHAGIHLWFQCLDVGLVPYAKTEFNRLCSPMRLFDHLAAGAPLVATDACGQVRLFGGQVAVCGTPGGFVDAVGSRLVGARPGKRVQGITWQDRADGMMNVMKELGFV